MVWKTPKRRIRKMQRSPSLVVPRALRSQLNQATLKKTLMTLMLKPTQKSSRKRKSLKCPSARRRIDG